MDQARFGQVFVSREVWERAGNAPAYKWHTWTHCFLNGSEPELQIFHELLWDGGETRGEPTDRRVPMLTRQRLDGSTDGISDRSKFESVARRVLRVWPILVSALITTVALLFSVARYYLTAAPLHHR